jgi:hypothetical protein
VFDLPCPSGSLDAQQGAGGQTMPERAAGVADQYDERVLVRSPGSARRRATKREGDKDMRTLLRMSIPVEKGNQSISSGDLQKVMPEILGQLKPEAAYFAPLDGKRTALIVFDLADPSQIPAIAERLFSAFNAEVDFSPVMNQDDLTKGLASLSR